jgi:dihydroxy-acid dehydratase
MKELSPLLHLDALTVNGRTVRENIDRAEIQDRQVILPLDQPLLPEGGTAILRGNLAPNGAVCKQSAASPELLRHRGRAVVFRSLDDLAARVDDPNLDVTERDVLVLQNAGVVGGPGMPEVGNLPIPKKLLQRGVRDIVRISDARMSGTAFGTIVLHVAPEAAVGGPLALVRDSDEIELDVPARRLQLHVSDAELSRRRAEWQPPQRSYTRGYGWVYLEHVLQADQGCDFDFLRADFRAGE